MTAYVVLSAQGAAEVCEARFMQLISKPHIIITRPEAARRVSLESDKKKK